GNVKVANQRHVKEPPMIGYAKQSRASDRLPMECLVALLVVMMRRATGPATASSCRYRPTGMARPESAYRTPGRRADCHVAAPVSFERRRAASPRAHARPGCCE